MFVARFQCKLNVATPLRISPHAAPKMLVGGFVSPLPFSFFDDSAGASLSAFLLRRFGSPHFDQDFVVIRCRLTHALDSKYFRRAVI